MKVLSLFDGISVAQQALFELGIESTYYASEIDKYALQITAKNFPKTIQLGDVKEVGCAVAFNLDLLIGGSPCQDLSIAKKNREGLSGARSGLFYEYLRILKEFKPEYFVLENVNSMPKEAKETITKELWGIEPIMINASLVSAQNRKRLFWVGKLAENKNGYWEGLDDAKYEKVEIKQPEDRGILLKDILENIEVPFTKYGVEKMKSNTVRTSGRSSGVDDKHNWDTLRIGQIGNGGQGDRVYSSNGKSVALSANGGGRGAKTGLYAVALRNRGQGKKPEIGGDKANAMTTVQTDSMVMENTIIRKLTPIECERLQSLTEIKQSCIIKVCLDHQNNYVNAENKNLKSLSVVGSVEKSDLNESVLFVEKNLNTSNRLISKPVQPDVLISCEENTLQIHYQNKLLVNVNGVEWKQNVHHLKSIEDFVRLVVGINTIVEKIIITGEVELPQKNSISIVVENGNNVVNLFGKGITQLANDAEKDLITLNKLLKSTTLDLFGQKNKEQIIQILFSFVINAIIGYIPKEIQNQNILTFQIKSKVGYTWGVSNSQRYKALGNAFNCEVIKHILKSII